MKKDKEKEKNKKKEESKEEKEVKTEPENPVNLTEEIMKDIPDDYEMMDNEGLPL